MPVNRTMPDPAWCGTTKLTSPPESPAAASALAAAADMARGAISAIAMPSSEKTSRSSA